MAGISVALCGFGCGGRARPDRPPAPVDETVEAGGTKTTVEAPATSGGRTGTAADPGGDTPSKPADDGSAPAGDDSAPADDGSAPADDGSAPADGEETTDDESGTSGAGDEESCSAELPLVRATLAWRQELGSQYGLAGQGEISYSPDGTRLVTPADQYVMFGYRVHRASDGVALESSKHFLLGRDRDWNWELRGGPTGGQLDGLRITDLRSGAAGRALGKTPAAAALSGDGRYVAALHCGDTPHIERHAATGGEVVTLRLDSATSPCPISGNRYYATQSAALPMAVGFSGASIAFTTDAHARVGVADVATGMISELAAHSEREGEALPEDDLLALAFSPSERLLATVASRTVRVVHNPGFQSALPDFPAGVTVAFTDCYCERRYFSPVAWSADGRYFATTDPDLAVVVRRSCDGAPLARIENAPASSTKGLSVPGPAFIAFAPDGTSLAVYSFEGDRDPVLSLYRLGA